MLYENYQTLWRFMFLISYILQYWNTCLCFFFHVQILCMAWFHHYLMYHNYWFLVKKKYNFFLWMRIVLYSFFLWVLWSVLRTSHEVLLKIWNVMYVIFFFHFMNCCRNFITSLCWRVYVIWIYEGQHTHYILLIRLWCDDVSNIFRRNDICI